MFELKYCWIRNYESKRKIPNHSHDFYEFILYIKGEGTTNINRKKYDFGPQSFVLIPPGIEHSEKHNGLSSVLIIGFTSDELIDDVLFFKNENIEVNKLVNKIRHENKMKAPYFEEIIKSEISELLFILKREKIPTNKKINSSIDAAVIYIDEYCLTDINLDELASNAGYCTDRFRNLFKELTGITPKQYIIQKRIEEAKKLLITTNEDLDSISNKLGFNYYSHFSLYFKKKTGLNPKEYRNKNKTI